MINFESTSHERDFHAFNVKLEIELYDHGGNKLREMDHYRLELKIGIDSFGTRISKPFRAKVYTKNVPGKFT
jgi:hypothetical protein